MRPYHTDDGSIPLRTDHHHIADNVRRQIVRSEPKKKKRSGNVNLCYECNLKVDTECLCHEEFSKRLRFYTEEMLEDLIARCEEKAGGEHVLFATETEERLNGRVMKSGKKESLPKSYYES